MLTLENVSKEGGAIAEIVTKRNEREAKLRTTCNYRLQYRLRVRIRKYVRSMRTELLPAECSTTASPLRRRRIRQRERDRSARNCPRPMTEGVRRHR